MTLARDTVTVPAAGPVDVLLDPTVAAPGAYSAVVTATPTTAGAHLRTLTTLAEIGAVVAPIVPAFYSKPKTVDDIINHTVGRLLDFFGIETKLVKALGRARPGETD